MVSFAATPGTHPPAAGFEARGGAVQEPVLLLQVYLVVVVSLYQLISDGLRPWFVANDNLSHH